ncbi:MAG: hypothetical protein QM708_12375 [Propioniciclava sp.]|uniref:hypothetical protein n=1 Tax=Propioniciclava sp. TaxID=2038686 RepID=UPI0039E3A2E8
MDDQDQYIEVWNDLVSPRDLTWSLVACGGATAVALILATVLSGNLFGWGLAGSVAGFIICAVIVAPKRTVRIVATDESSDPASAASPAAGGGVTRSAS